MACAPPCRALLRHGHSRPAAVTRAAQRSERAGTIRAAALRLYLDCADVQQWKASAALGVLYGFTTNPVILQRDGVPCTLDALKGLTHAARDLDARELQLQAWGGDVKELHACALALHALDPDLITVKLPCTPQGLAAAAAFTAERPGAQVTITGLYTPQQALLAQAAGAAYAAPYLGRMADGHLTRGTASNEGEALVLAMDEVVSMAAAANACGSPLRVLVASIRAAEHMAMLASRGCDTFTFGPAVMTQLTSVDATLRAVDDFEAAAMANGGSVKIQEGGALLSAV